MYTFKKHCLGKKQKGMAVLLISIILLVLITLVSLYLARSVLMEKTLINNDMRSKQAFEAAEAGVSVAQNYFIKGIAQNTAEGKYTIFASVQDGALDSFKGGIGESNFSVKLTEIAVDEQIGISIVSTGTSADSTATKTISIDIFAINPLPNIPDNPISAKGAFFIGGSGTVHNTEGHSTIWAGGDVDVGSNNSTKTLIADPTSAGYPTCMDIPNSCDTMESSNSQMAGLDIIEYDSDLANLTDAEMFYNFFGMTPEAYKETMAKRIIDTASPADSAGDCGNSFAGCVDGATNEVVWWEGDFDNNGGVFGCDGGTGNMPTDTTIKACPEANELPSILIINGNASFKGNGVYSGIVFILGDLTSGSGSLTIHGALVTTGNSNTGSGSLDVLYNSRLLENLIYAGPRSISSGSWKDF